MAARRHLRGLLLGAIAACAGVCALEPDPTARAAELATADGWALCALSPEPVRKVATVKPPPAPVRACPEGMADMGAFCVDRWEAHLVTCDGDVDVVHPHYKRPEPGVRYEARSKPGVFPQAYVSRREAAAACHAAGKRLCTLHEFRRACQGSAGTRYPYGDKEEAGACNTGKEHLLTKVFGTNPYAWTHDELNSPQLNQQPGYLAKTGATPRCKSEGGLYDMVGNVHEWVSDTVSTAFMEALLTDGHYRRTQPWREGNAVFAGGFFSTQNQHGPGCLFTTVAHQPRYHDYSTGFRCCADH